jgi:very-short-patch-repair endonuclease
MSSVKIEGTLAGKIGFASHQNAVPVLRELQVVNDGETDHRDLVLELAASPPFLAPKSWRIDQLAKGASLHITDRDVKLDATFLAGLAESLTGDITLSLKSATETLATRTHPVELLAQNEWGGVNAMPELLAAFSMPNDPAVDRVLKAASDVLRRAGKNDSIDGYASQSRTRAWEIASALWSAVCGFRISYALPPASFETQGQKIRTPGAILEGGVATCLDTALLFAAALEQAGLNALIVITEGHAFAGAWLQPQEFSQLITDEVSAVRKRIDLKELLVFETTLATRSPAPSFSDAVADAQRQVNDEDFILALDIHRARMQRIRPLALASTLPAGTGEEAVSAAEALEEAPVLPGFDVDIAPEPDTPAGKLILWQRKLLDLTTRNRLLHLPEGAKAIRLVCPEPAALEDRLADGKRIRIVAMPDLEAGGRDAALYEQQNRENLREAYARTALSRGEVVATLESAKLEAALVDMYRKSRSDLDEGGANTLFLAMGFLQWKKTPDDPKSYSAPLILLPVKLERKSALSGVTLSLLEDEPRFNLTLLELLRHDFELVIPGLDGELPGDENGVDIEGIWNTVRRAVRDVPGFEVTAEMVLGTFSFAKYLMWKDLADRSEQLMQSPLVKHLLGRTEAGGEGYVSGGDFPRPEELDRKVDLANLFTPLPADSSQLAAVVASANGCDFVLDGPPGTGKSQTIANMIAHNLAMGRRVLFVAEKMAALDVVNRRLEEKGLGEFCLELHSSKTSKVEVLKQLERAWDTRDTLTAEQWEAEAAEVQRLRDKLNGVVGMLHKRWPNGLSAYQAIGRVVRDASDATPRLSWSDGTQHDAATFAQLRDVARRLELNRQAAQGLSTAFGLVTRSDWSNSWQAALVTAAHDVPPAIDAVGAARTQVLTATRLPLPDARVDQWLTLGNVLLDAHGMDLSFAFAPDMKARVASAHRGLELLDAYRQLEQRLSVRYAPESSRRLPIEQIEQEWTAASGKFWFFATWAKKKVARALAAQGGATGMPDVAADLQTLKQLRALLTELDGLNASLTGMPGWSALASDTAQTAAALAVAERLRPALSALASSPEHLVELRRATASLVVEANDLLGKDGSIAIALHRLQTAYDSYVGIGARFMDLATGSAELPADVQALRTGAVAVTGQATQLKAWCDWCRVRDEAIALGLAPLVHAVVTQSVADGSAVDVFETAYARWFAAAVIDAEPLLRNFVPAEHMSDIASYRQLDDRLAALSVRFIRARLCGLIPAKNEIGKQGGFGILKHELQKSRRHKPLRQLAAEMGDAMGKLAPCMLMSPLSIAQYLPPDQALFDLVIFDEASQIAPWDAIGSIARGKQVVIAGDPRQMPPTSFFARGPNATEDDTEEDMESILDECLGAGVPSHSLSWHYRSRHESLIAFSNHRYYDSKLITFPAAETRASAVEWRRVQGVYAKGKGRFNQLEAEAMVAETVRRLLDPAFTGAGRSIGIITLNTDQQKLVTDLLDRARQQYPEIEPYFQEDQREPVVVKNLETVQGDERDLIMLGIGYGPTEPGANSMSMNFGPLNKEGGWRRLNVAVTRARREMLVFSSFDPSMVDLNRTSARAVRDLKHFIEFAQRGPRALAEAVQGSVGSYDSPFEEAVADALRDKGWQVVPQIGVSRFRIDLGIVHPDRPGDYLVGIECDGATYHSAATARDRDKVRSGVLQGLGWTLLRLWSTEWWVDKAGALERLHAAIEAELAKSRAQAVVPAPTEVATPVIDFAGVTGQAAEDADDASDPSADPDIRATEAASSRLARSATPQASDAVLPAFDFADLTPRIDAARFYQADYDEMLALLVDRVFALEPGVSDAMLVQRIARAHGFARSGRLIRERVLDTAAKRTPRLV